jgi:hypothetical protein
MTKEREALRMTLAALYEHSGNYKLNAAMAAKQAAAIAAGEEALAAPSDSVEQEPLTEWLVCPKCSYKSPYSPIKAKTLAEDAERITKQTRAALAQQEPVYRVTVVDDQHPSGIPLKQWVGLTDDEIFKTHKQVDSMQYLTFGKAIEAKLKELNS